MLFKKCSSHKELFCNPSFSLFSLHIGFIPVAPTLKILCNVSSAAGESLGLLSLGRLWLPSSRAVFEFLGRMLDLQHVGLKPHGKQRRAILAGSL